MDGLVLLTAVPLGLLALGMGAHAANRRARQRRLTALGHASGMVVTQQGLLAPPTLQQTQGELTVVARHTRLSPGGFSAETVDVVELKVRGLVFPAQRAFKAGVARFAGEEDGTPVLPGFDVETANPELVRGVLWAPEVQVARERLGLEQLEPVLWTVDAMGVTLVVPQAVLPASAVPQRMQQLLDLARALEGAAHTPARRDVPSQDGARGPASGIPMAVRR